MDALLRAFLEILKTVGTGAMAGAKAVGKGATEVGKWGWNRMQQGAGLTQPTSINELAKAFGATLPFAEAAQQDITPSMDLDINPQTQRLMQVPMGTSQLLPKTPQEYSQFQPTMPTIPPQHRNYSQQSTGQRPNQQTPNPGFTRGFIENLLGIPQTSRLNEPDISTGRKTAYYTGGLMSNIIKSRIMPKANIPSSAEAAAQQTQISNVKLTTQEKQKQLNLQGDLSKAVGLVPKLSPEQKESLYTDLVTKYPDSPTDIRRILFPEEYYGKDQTGVNAMRRAMGLS